MMRAILVALLAMACLAAAQKNKGNRPKPSLRDRQERQKDLFWFKVAEEDTEACKDVDEAAVEIVPGAPGDRCKVSRDAVITNAKILRCSSVSVSSKYKYPFSGG